jgi:hypothetical protein
MLEGWRLLGEEMERMRMNEQDDDQGEDFEVWKDVQDSCRTGLDSAATLPGFYHCHNDQRWRSVYTIG